MRRIQRVWAHKKATGQMNDMNKKRNRFYQSRLKIHINLWMKHDGTQIKMKSIFLKISNLCTMYTDYGGKDHEHDITGTLNIWTFFFYGKSMQILILIYYSVVENGHNGSCYGSQPEVCYMWMKWSVCLFIITSFFFFEKRKNLLKSKGDFVSSFQVAAVITTTQNTMNFSIQLRIADNVHKLSNGNNFLRKK